MFLFSCAYAYAYVACVMFIAQVGTRLNRAETEQSKNMNIAVIENKLSCCYFVG